MKKTTSTTLRVERSIPASPAQVFEAWTNPAALAEWWSPPGGRCVGAEMDVRPGGRYVIHNELGDGTVMSIGGEYLTVDPPNLLRFTWSTGNITPATEIVTVTFAPAGTETRLTITHDRISDPEAQAGHQAGWQSCLDGLVQHASRGR